jgi:hypothetical protein
MIGGQEHLIVADCLNDVLHVLDVNGKFICHLGADCPEIIKPTALCPHPENQHLWIGCQGRHILIKAKFPYNWFEACTKTL